MAETYYLGAYWGPRKETAKECALRTQGLLQDLAQVDPLFSRWFKQARTLKKALERPLETDLANIASHIQGNLMRDDRRVPMEDLGFYVWLWNGEDGDGFVELSFLCGGYWKQANNRCTLKLPSTGPHAERLLTGPVLTRLLRCMARAWEPDWAVAMSDAHRDFVKPQYVEDAPYVAWVTYLSRRRGTVPPLPAPVQVERVEDKGTLITLTPERFTAANPEHVALAERVRQWLDRAGLLQPSTA